MCDFPNFLFDLQSFVPIFEDENPISWGDWDNPNYLCNKFEIKYILNNLFTILCVNGLIKFLQVENLI